MKTLAADTTVFIFFAKLALLEMLCEHFEVMTTPEVAAEATRRRDLPDAQYIQSFIEEKKIQIKKAPAAALRSFQKKWGLGKGESSILILATLEKALIVTDDYAAMRVGKAIGLSFTTTPLLVVQFQRRGFLSLELARAKLDELGQFAWISQDVLEGYKKILGGD